MEAKVSGEPVLPLPELVSFYRTITAILALQVGSGRLTIPVALLKSMPKNFRLTFDVTAEAVTIACFYVEGAEKSPEPDPKNRLSIVP